MFFTGAKGDTFVDLQKGTLSEWVHGLAWMPVSLGWHP